MPRLLHPQERPGTTGGWAPGPVWTGTEYLAPPTFGFCMIPFARFKVHKAASIKISIKTNLFV